MFKGIIGEFKIFIGNNHNQIYFHTITIIKYHNSKTWATVVSFIKTKKALVYTFKT